MTRAFHLHLALAAATLALTACSETSDTAAPGSTAAPAAAQLPAVDVTTTTVSAHTEPQFRRLPGTVQATARATLAARTMGTVTAAPAIGQRVEAGDLLVTLSAPELDAAVAQATAAFDLATRNHQREAALLPRGAATAETVRNLDDQRRIAAAQLEAATARLAHTRIAAPFPGTVAARLLETGDLASPGTPLVTLEGNLLEVQVAVPASLVAATVGDTVAIELSADATVDATVTESSPATDPVTRSRLVRLALPVGSPAGTGQFVHVQWPDQPAELLTVPSTALSAFGQMQRVFVATDGRAVLRLVKAGQRLGDRVVILSGLNPGERVVTHPPASLRDGQPLKVTASR